MPGTSKTGHTSRAGTSTLEALVAFTLLSSVLAVSTTLIVHNGRMLAGQRDYRLALDELSNQLDRLAALPAEQRDTAIKELSPSEFIAARLVGAKLTGELTAEEPGQRITLHLHWDEPQRSKAPVSLTAWTFPNDESQPPRSETP